MKKTLRILFFSLTIIFLIIILSLGYYFITTQNNNLDISKLENTNNNFITFFDNNNEKINSNIKQNYVKLEQIPSHTVNAFIAIEDKRFYSHKGIDNKAIVRAVFNNIKTFSFKEGASTISQQLIKNTHLTNDKTINRKLTEIKLAKQLEKKYSKNKIIELYLNNIYFGDNCYGIYRATKHYFNKEPNELNINESATLAGIVRSPYNYSPTKNYDASIKRKNIVLNEMKKQGYISENQYKLCLTQDINISKNSSNNNYGYSKFLTSELDKILDKKRIVNNELKIYTTIDQTTQDILEKNTLLFLDKADSASSIIMDKTGGIKAFYSNKKQMERQLGSIIKPFLIYAPAFEANVINEATIIEDEKAVISGKTIKNYNDNYRGIITAKDGLIYSSNVASAKILNSIGIDKAKRYVKNLPINLQSDQTINLSIGSTENGATLKNVITCYLPFLNEGLLPTVHIIDKIEDKFGKEIYSFKNYYKKIFNNDTAFLINDCLHECVTKGTAKKLFSVNENLCSKTGTVGNANGNMDAYSIAYDKNIISGIWIGNERGNLMDNTVTGGTYPTIINKNILEKYYLKNEKPSFFDKPNSISSIYLDKISLYNERKQELADNSTPENQKEMFYVNKKTIPKSKSSRYTSPIIKNAKLLVNSCGFLVRLSQTEYCDFQIFIQNNNEKKLLYDSKISGKKEEIEFEDTNLHGEVYIIPYYNDISGKKIILGKIKPPKNNIGGWWVN